MKSWKQKYIVIERNSIFNKDKELKRITNIEFDTILEAQTYLDDELIVLKNVLIIPVLAYI